MKIGSIVKLVNDKWKRPDVPWVRPRTNKTYTVRDIVLRSGSHCLLLEEIVNRKMLLLDTELCKTFFQEPAFCIKKFRELLPPDALSDEIKEALEDQTVTYN